MTQVVQILQSNERYSLKAPRLMCLRPTFKFKNVRIDRCHTVALVNGSGRAIVVEDVLVENTLNFIDGAGGNDFTINRVQFNPPEVP